MKNSTKLLLPALLFLLISCGTARRGEPLFEPIPITNPAIAKGEVVFKTYCQKCHPGGEAGLAPAINNKPIPGFVIRRQIRIGFGAMPGFNEEVISDEEMDNLMAYIKTLRKAKKKKDS